VPTYSYKCTECGEAFDIQQAFTDDALTVCPNCGGKLRKVFGTVGVTFNGSGFYRTDSRPKPSESGSGSGSGSSGGSKEKKTSASSDTGSKSSGASASGGSGGGSSASATASSKAGGS
jgi:putative FmdB family regulatory protein